MTDHLTPQMLALYLGCECYDEYDDDIKILWSVSMDDSEYPVILKKKVNHFRKIKEIKLLLRPLDSMTEEEKTFFVLDANDLNKEFVINEFHFQEKHDRMKEYYFDALTKADDDMNLRLGASWYFRSIPYLLSKHFDIFGLVENGLAIDATKIKKP